MRLLTENYFLVDLQEAATLRTLPVLVRHTIIFEMSTHGIMMYRVFSGYLLTVLLVPSVAHMPARLIGGTADEGRLEILYNGTWSTVCDDKFGQEEALVACRMLGYNSTTAVPVGSPKYGGGYGLILLDDLECDGNETSLTQCKHSGLYTHNCDHSEDVGVMCNLSAWPSLQQMSARVVDGTSDSGRLEIFYHGTWSTVCDDGFGQEDALVACRMLGFNSTTAIPVGSYKYGEGLGPILLDEVECQGNETSLAQCKHSGFYIHGCGHPDDVGVICNINLIIARLVDGTSEAGRLELFVNEEWGTVCGKNFGRKEALVACRMLGFNSSNTTATAVSSFKYGDGSGDILLFDLKCTRTESSLVQCSNAVFYTNICEHSQDVGIICNANPVIARLVNGTSEAGRLELLVNGEWGTVCNDGFDQKDAQVACRMLGFNSTAIIATAVTSSKYGQGSGDILLSDLNCGGSETSLEECSHEGFYYSYCDHSKDVGIICNVSPIIARVADGTSEAGRLELFFNGEWSTVCNKQFGRKNAQVACRMLGFNSTSTNVAVVSSSKYGHGSGNILLYNLNCHGTETSLEQCSQRGFYNKHCSHSEDVGIICNIIEQMRARLVNGTSAAGRLEIFFNGEWGTVCSGISFQTKEAQVACRMLGYNSTGAAIIDTEKYGQGAGPVLLQNMFYKGTESSLDQCSIELYSRNCDHENDAGVICNIMSGDQLAARLVNGTSEGGRLEIFFDGEWGTVCDWRFGNKEAEVACRMLGFKSNGAAAISSDKYGEGAGHVLLQNVKCQGTEYSLEQCKLGLLYSRQCDHKQDVGVICNIKALMLFSMLVGTLLGRLVRASPLTARLYGGTSEAGRLQIDFNGEWSTVCHSAVNQNEIEVACKILGFNSSGQAAVKSLRFGDGSGFKISYMKCRGMETSLEQCEFGQLHKTSCFDVGILCDVRNFSLLLTGPRRTSSNTGRVEVKIGSEHLSTVCVKDEKTAAVICRQLNLPLNVAALIDGWSVGGKKSPVLEASFVCDGNEKNLLECGRNKSTGDCYSDDVGVVCSKHNQLYIVSEAEMYPFMEGAKGALMCAKSRNYPQALEYTWASKADGRPQGNLLFYDNLTREYNGRKVSCQAYISDNAYNVDELLQSDTLELNIYYKPLIKLKWADNTGTRQPVSNLSELNPGQNVTLWCEADSNPLPASITWSGRVNSTTGELRIIAAEHVTHSGLYTCTVVTQTVDDDDRLPLRSSYQLTLSVQGGNKSPITDITPFLLGIFSFRWQIFAFISIHRAWRPMCIPVPLTSICLKTCIVLEIMTIIFKLTMLSFTKEILLPTLQHCRNWGNTMYKRNPLALFVIGSLV